jgi:hypothetical protein
MEIAHQRSRLATVQGYALTVVERLCIAFAVSARLVAGSNPNECP